jgi:hypothetical protein
MQSKVFPIECRLKNLRFFNRKFVPASQSLQGLMKGMVIRVMKERLH